MRGSCAFLHPSLNPVLVVCVFLRWSLCSRTVPRPSCWGIRATPLCVFFLHTLRTCFGAFRASSLRVLLCAAQFEFFLNSNTYIWICVTIYFHLARRGAPRLFALLALFFALLKFDEVCVVLALHFYRVIFIVLVLKLCLSSDFWICVRLSSSPRPACWSAARLFVLLTLIYTLVEVRLRARVV